MMYGPSCWSLHVSAAGCDGSSPRSALGPRVRPRSRPALLLPVPAAPSASTAPSRLTRVAVVLVAVVAVVVVAAVGSVDPRAWPGLRHSAVAHLLVVREELQVPLEARLVAQPDQVLERQLWAGGLAHVHAARDEELHGAHVEDVADEGDVHDRHGEQHHERLAARRERAQHALLRLVCGVRRVVHDHVDAFHERRVAHLGEEVVVRVDDVLEAERAHVRRALAVVVKWHPHACASVRPERGRQLRPRAPRRLPLIVRRAAARHAARDGAHRWPVRLPAIATPTFALALTHAGRPSAIVCNDVSMKASRHRCRRQRLSAQA